MKVVCVIVNRQGKPVNDYYLNDLELAEEMCSNLMDNYNQYFGVRILTSHPNNN